MTTTAKNRLDAIGALASIACAIHCAALPLVGILLPLIGLGILADARMEWAFVTVSAGFGVWSMCLGYREHRSCWPVLILGLGLTLLIGGRIAEQQNLLVSPLSILLVVVGGVSVAASHLVNRTLRTACHHSPSSRE